MRRLNAAAMALLVLAGAANARPGDYDPTWAGCGGPFKLLSPGTALVAPSGKVIGVYPGLVFGCLPNGGPDMSFAGVGFGVYVPPLGLGGIAAAVDADGTIVKAGPVYDPTAPTTTHGIGLLRIRPDGYPDTDAGVYVGKFRPMAAEVRVAGVVIQTDGKVVVAGEVGTAAVTAFVVRFHADGTPDPSFGDSGYARLSTATAELRHLTGIASDRDGKLVILGDVPPTATRPHAITAAARLSPSGVLDAGFGSSGIVTVDLRALHDSIGLAVLPLANGGIALAATVAEEDSRTLVLVRVLDDGKLDAGFGYGGRVTTPVRGSQWANLHAMSDGRLIVVANGASGNKALRYFADGKIDTSFGDAGSSIVASLSNFERMSTALQDDDFLLVPGTTLFARVSRYSLQGPATPFRIDISPMSALGDAVTVSSRLSQPPPGRLKFYANSLPIPGCEAVGYIETIDGYNASCQFTPAATGIYRIHAELLDLNNVRISTSPDVVLVVNPPGTSAAVEYYHALYDHYFITSEVVEMGRLDHGMFSGWERTGKVFSVWPTGTTGKFAVCRFWSAQAFAPRSSHFYTPYAQECATVQANKSWQYEGVVMAYDLPAGNGDCPVGTATLYRVYNAGQGGAPNHRYFTDASLKAEMAFRGWIAEGTGGDSVFACLPATGLQ